MVFPSHGDILKLSQVAWRLGRAFTVDQTNAPIEFKGVEVKLSALARALKELAEVLHTDTCIRFVEEAAKNIHHGIRLIIESCERSIHDLDSLVDHNQIIKKHRTVGGFAIERTWSDLVFMEYDSMIWTSEGGDLRSLQHLLDVHTSSIVLLVHALQSGSSSSLDRIVSPMADRVQSIYGSDNFDHQLEEVHDILERLLLSVPSTSTPLVPTKNPERSPEIKAQSPSARSAPPTSPSAISPRRQNVVVSLPKAPWASLSTDHLRKEDLAIVIRPPSSLAEPTTPNASSPTRKRVSDFSFGGASFRYSSSSYASSTASSRGISAAGTPQDSAVSRQPPVATPKTSKLLRTPDVHGQNWPLGDDALPLVPPPAVSSTSRPTLERVASVSSLSPYPSSQAEFVKLHRSSTTASQKAAFEREAFRNSAVLCDVRGKMTEYSHQINEDDPRDVEMIRATDECRIAVVRKRVHDPETKAIRVVTSVWVFSEDNTVRMELRMDDTQMYIPYSSYFSPTKVSITVPCELKFYDVKLGNRLAKFTKTSWVNYVFDTSEAASLFQNELMGRTLLATFRTEKTMRVHSGLSKSFTYASQMCGLENLRVWEDNETGGIIALIHFSADFRPGYLAFYLNSSTSPIKVKDDGHREVKIKGLKVPLDASGGRKDSVVGEKGRSKGKDAEKERVISGARIEFASEEEKTEFLEMCIELQRELIELPDLMGVN